MKKVRDMSAAQFAAALKSEGMAPAFFGYVTVTFDAKGHPGLHVYPGNAGPNRRAQLAYLMRERDRHIANQAPEVAP